MEFLSKTLKQERQVDKESKISSKHELSKALDFGASWRFQASEEDEKRRTKKVWSKQQALLIASKVDR